MGVMNNNYGLKSDQKLQGLHGLASFDGSAEDFGTYPEFDSENEQLSYFKERYEPKVRKKSTSKIFQPQIKIKNRLCVLGCCCCFMLVQNI